VKKLIPLPQPLYRLSPSLELKRAASRSWRTTKTNRQIEKKERGFLKPLNGLDYCEAPTT
jgi:hypothetical protein